MGRRIVRVETPADTSVDDVPDELRRCYVEDWVTADELVFGNWARDNTLGEFAFAFECEARRRWAIARSDAGAPRVSMRPAWRATPYPEQRGWAPTFESPDPFPASRRPLALARTGGADG